MIIKNLPEDSQIQFISELFKYEHLKTWNLRLCIKANEQEFFRHTRLSNLPAIAKRRVINSSNGQTRKRGYQLSLSGVSTTNWQVGIDSESCGNTFVFDYRISSSSIVKIHIPQIEFARILFFHNAYLARNCIDHGVLSREFWIRQMQDYSILINVLPTCTLPLKTFDNEGERRLLAWILLDSNARASYESIAKTFTKESVENQGQKTWKFSFEPPKLDNLSLEAIGWLDKKTNNYYIYEITSIGNISSSLYKKVQFYSDRFKIGTQSSNSSRGSGGSNNTDSGTIDDQQDASADTKVKKIDVPKTSFSFINPIETLRVVKRKAKGRLNTDTEPNDEFVELDLSSDEAVIDGTACQADFSGLDDESEVLELYMQRFEAFKLLIERLSKQHNIGCHEELHFLPAIGRSRLHRTIDGNKRSLLEVRVKTDISQFVVLEIDTTDNSKPISTLIIKINNLNYWNDHMDELLSLVVKKSLRWPKDSYLERFGTVQTLNHPKDMLELTESSDDFIRWQKRLDKILGLAG